MTVGRIRGKHVQRGLVAVGLALTGCPGAGELENPERFELFKEPQPPTSCDQELPAALPSGCDFKATLETYCARSGCHGGVTGPGAGLSLRFDDLLIARLLEQPATHSGVTCSVGMPCVASEATCGSCAVCPQNALLVDRQNPTESWILKKMDPFIPGTTTVNLDIGCGDAMPSFYTNASVIAAFAEKDKACLTEFFNYIATSTPNPERFPCTPEVDGGAPDGGTSDGGT